MAQLDLFTDSRIYRWPCLGPGPGVRRYTGPVGGWWRALPRPVLSGWHEEHTEHGPMLRRHWLHPRPAGRPQQEIDRTTAASLNLDTLRWWAQCVPTIDEPARWGSYCRGEAGSREQAVRDADAALRRMDWVGGEE